MRAHRRTGYMLLETTIATGLLVAGLAVIGAQVQQADVSVRKMGLRIRALMLAEMKLAELDLGLVKLDSVDFVQEEDFGPRYPDFGWRLTTEETSVKNLYELQFEVLYLVRDDPYEQDSFDHDNAENLYTLYAMRARPQELDLGEALGLDETAVDELGQRLDLLAIPGLSVEAFDPTILASLDFKQFIEVLPLIADAFGIDLTQMMDQLPPDIVKLIEGGGLAGDEADGEQADGGGTP